uniref:Glucose-methanol-choline oxidoreductase N-terminal domain-containing protein n=1 Tax=Glossina austeni TaxID=7395 RepID=A0A1A9VL97_GLOAU
MQFSKLITLVSILIGVASVLWFAIAALVRERIPNILKPMDGYIFDYVVVGAGSAGCVVASLLAKYSNATVLLVEAGSSFGFLSKIPLLTTFQQKGLNDWNFVTRQFLPRGKGLGGSSQLNYMLQYEGFEGDFERWAREYNLKDWQWSTIKPYIQAAQAKPYERLDIPATYSKITYALSQLHTEFVHKSWSYRPAQYNIKNGLRFNVLERFLQPAYLHNNLRIMTNTLAKQIVFVRDKNGKQNKVKFLKVSVKPENKPQDQTFLIEVRHELIISAGAYQTPQLLIISGLGDRANLEKFNITSNAQLPNLPMVGQQLHDHLIVPLFVSIEQVGPTVNQRALLNPLTWLKYIFMGGGHLGNFGVVGFIDNTQGPASDHYSLTLCAVGAIDERALMSISNFKRADFRALFPRYHNTSQEGFVINSVCLQPLSRGTVKIDDLNIRKKPIIDPNYLSKAEDINCTIKAIRAAVEVVTSNSFSDLGVQIHWPRLKGCFNYGPFENDFQANQPSDDYLECIIRHVGLSSHHPAGTCAMGLNSTNSVVDSQFRVHNIKNLRIIDASVLPTPLSGNPNSIIVGMAVRGVSLILKDYVKNKRGKL